MEDEKPSFVANSVLPNFNVGTILTAGGPTGGSVESFAEWRDTRLSAP